MKQDTGKKERAVISPPLPLNKRDNRAKQQARIPGHERYHNLFCQALISVLSRFVLILFSKGRRKSIIGLLSKSLNR
ncbi:hypothetical protein BK140_29215 [Paenibacillus macerans]|nr:hypothetical protein BK140_29215 [Paenibacillus macerans]